MTPIFTWVLAFDVAHPRRRRKLSRFLEQRAARVQRSVFELIGTERALAALLVEALAPERFEPSHDSLRAYRACDVCQGAARVRGAGPSLRTAHGALVFP